MVVRLYVAVTLPTLAVENAINAMDSDVTIADAFAAFVIAADAQASYDSWHCRHAIEIAVVENVHGDQNVTIRDRV